HAMTLVYLGLGTNLGSRARNLSAARRRLREKGVRILRQSRVMETAPWGVAEQPRFLNQVVEGDWGGTPRALLRAAKQVERDGRRAAGVRASSTSTSCCSARSASGHATWWSRTRASVSASSSWSRSPSWGLTRAGVGEPIPDPGHGQHVFHPGRALVNRYPIP